jgi:tetratricopeptide (TPR) repeat protein
MWMQAHIEGGRGNRAAAISRWKSYAREYPDERDAWFQLGYQNMKLGHYEEAVKYYKKVIALDRFNAATYNNLAGCYSQLGRYDEAIPNYLKAFELRPEWLTVSNLNHEFGYAYIMAGEFQKAEETFKLMFSENNAKKARGHRTMGQLNMYLGKYDEATRELREAVSLSKIANEPLSEAIHHLYLARIFKTKGMRETAVEELLAAEKLLVTDGDGGVKYFGSGWLGSLGKMYARMDRLDGANRALQEVLGRMNKNSQFDRANLNLLKGEIELARGNNQNALKFCDVSFKLSEINRMLESLAYANFKNGNLDEAVKNYKDIVDKKSITNLEQEDWILAYYQLGKIYEDQKDIENSIQYYERFLEIWKDADEDVLPLIDAKARLAELKRLSRK